MNDTAASQTSKIKTTILAVINNSHPENVNQLIEIVRQQTKASAKEITNELIDLETENKLTFRSSTKTFNVKTKKFYSLKNTSWYWITLTLIGTSIVFFSLSNLNVNTPYLSYLRLLFGFTFVLFLPGYTLVKMLFGSKMLYSTLNKTDYVELAGLSIGLSTILVPIIGLVLNYTPWGITLETLVITLAALTGIFATSALLKELFIET